MRHRRVRLTALLAWLAACALALPVAAQPDSPAPTVRSVMPAQGGLGARLTLTVDNLAGAIKDAGQCAGIVLFVGDLPMKGLAPDRCDPDDGHIGFTLRRTTDTSEAWHALLGRPTSFRRPVKITIGSAIDRSYPSMVTDYSLVLLPRARLYLFVVVAALVTGLFIVLSRRSELLRDPGPAPAPGQRRSYSLSRCQMAFWSLLVVLGYLFVWVVTGELDTITDSVLALMGISSGTALGARLIDAGKDDAASGQQKGLLGEKTALADTIAKLEKQLAAAAPSGTEAVAIATALASKKGRLVEVEASLQAAPSAGAPTSTGFLRDILSDESGVSIQRLQMAVWTFVLGVIFCASVYATLRMPEFSATLLGLMGISSGTYIGFKFPER